MSIPAAVAPPDGSPDPGVPWHYGDPLREQRALADGSARVDLSNRGVVSVTGPDRLRWLHDLTTQHLAQLAPGGSALALILSPHGHVEHELHAVDDGETTWLVVEPGTATALVDYLRSMQFMLRVEVADRSEDLAVVWEPSTERVEGYPTWLVPPDFAGTGLVDAGSDRGGDAGRYVPERPAAFPGREVVVPRSELAGRLAADGWELVDEAADADAVVVNTCGFVEQAKKDSVDTLLAAADLKDDGRARAVVAVGCLAERYGEIGRAHV